MRDDLQTFEDPGVCPSEMHQSAAAQSVVTLRVMATSDIHMQLQGFDYIEDRPTDHAGLAGLATLIRAAREEAAANDMPCVLLDNGDLLQGTVLGQRLAQEKVTPDHPVVACMNILRYDGMGIGNHDLDHGLPYLCDVASQLGIPVISSNLQMNETSHILRSAVLRRDLSQAYPEGASTLRIGLVSALPEGTANWNAYELRAQAQVLPARESLIEAVNEVRANGADVVILLAHMGLENKHPNNGFTDDARQVASIPGIDAIVSGHTHRRLPGEDHAGFALVDEKRGVLGQRPAVMPGFDASDLAILDLKLGRTSDGAWQVLDHRTELRANTATTPPDPIIVSLCEPAHQQTRHALTKDCGHSDLTIHNFFSLAMPTETCALVASAKRRVVAQTLRTLGEPDVPILATASAHTAGGRGGPRHFLHIPPGTVYLRHLAGLSPYANTICALRVTGEDIRRWLEHTGGIFSLLRPDAPDQMLLHPDRPAFDFDTIFGLDYAIDPTRAPGDRITRLTFDGTSIAADQPFILATSTFRASGGGGGYRFAEDKVVFRSKTCVSAALIDVLADTRTGFDLRERPWRFACPTPVRAIIRTAPQSLRYLSQIAHLSPQDEGIDTEGFARIRLTL